MKHWQIVAHVSELAQPDDYLCLPWKIDGELAIMRNADGSLTAFDNRCPHRGARIFTTLRGNRPPVCGYHGRCAKPSEVKAFPLAIVDGWVVVLDSHDEPWPALVTPWLEELRRLTPADACYVSTLGPLEYACHWTVAVENALDREHIVTVHADTLAPLGLRSMSVREYPDGSSLEKFDAVEGGEKLDRLCELFREPNEVDYFHLHVFPHTALSSTRGTSYSLQHYFPRADGKTVFLTRLYGTPAKNEAAGQAFLESVAKFNTKVFREDAVVCALVAPDHRGKLQPNEARIAHFREFAR